MKMFKVITPGKYAAEVYDIGDLDCTGMPSIRIIFKILNGEFKNELITGMVATDIALETRFSKWLKALNVKNVNIKTKWEELYTKIINKKCLINVENRTENWRIVTNIELIEKEK